MAASRGALLYQMLVTERLRTYCWLATPNSSTQPTSQTATGQSNRRRTSTTSPIRTNTDATHKGAPNRGLFSTSSDSSRGLDSSGGWLK